MTKGQTTLVPKQTIPSNYRPITCLPMMWNILTTQIKGEIYLSLVSGGLFPEKQRGCYRGTRGTGDLLYIDQHIFKNRKTRRKNVAIALIVNKKTYDMILQTGTIEYLKIYKISNKVINLISEAMKNLKVELCEEKH